ncbi:MAG: hypothetical protein GX176_08820 [Syntrophomonadaceae bacterium]|nr:hypothetical protein [Syntrophomonadaceae bacterium]
MCLIFILLHPSGKTSLKRHIQTTINIVKLWLIIAYEWRGIMMMEIQEAII